MTASPEIESQPVWAPDSRKLAYVFGARRRPADLSLRLRGGVGTRAHVAATATDLSPVFSPDGKSLAFLRNRRELRVHRPRDRRRSAARHRRVRRHDRRSEAGLVARRPVDRALRDRREGVHQRRARPRRRRRAAAARELSRQRVHQLASSGAATARTCCSTRASAPSPANSRASISRSARRSSARICFAICSREPAPDDREPEPETWTRNRRTRSLRNRGTPEPRNPGTPEPRTPSFPTSANACRFVPIGLDVSDVDASARTARRPRSSRRRRARRTLRVFARRAGHRSARRAAAVDDDRREGRIRSSRRTAARSISWMPAAFRSRPSSARGAPAGRHGGAHRGLRDREDGRCSSRPGRCCATISSTPASTA